MLLKLKCLMLKCCIIPTVKTKIMICAHCSNKIQYSRYCEHFRSCDADVCSLSCAAARLKYIRTFDPELNSPLFWPQSKSSDVSCNTTFQNNWEKHKLRESPSMDLLPTISDSMKNQEETTSSHTTQAMVFIASVFSIIFVCVTA